MVGANCGLHPLIHTHLEFNLAQYIEKRQVIAQQKNPPLAMRSQWGLS